MVFLSLSWRQPALGEENSPQGARYRVEAGVLFGLLTFSMTGSIDEQIDRDAGRYRVVVAGQGPGIANRVESSGVVRGRRLVPRATYSRFNIRGRDSWTAITYDLDRGLIDYNHVSHTFFLGRRREVHDVVRLGPEQPVDDVVTATLNYAQNALDTDPSGAFQTYVVRRVRPEREAPDDVQAGGYRAEIVPFVFRVTRDPVGGRDIATFDLSRFSSWARAENPARITFGTNRRPDTITADLILGTTVRITFESG